jgi:DNA-binding transcriptional ArsR family regulator
VALVMDRTGSRTVLSAEIDWSTAYELLRDLSSYLDVEMQPTFEASPTWFDDLRTMTSPSLRAGIERLGASGGGWGSLVGLAWHRRLRSAAELLASLESIDPVELRLVLLGAHWPALRAEVPPQDIMGAARGEGEAAERLVETVRRIEPDSDELDVAALRRLVALDPPSTKDAVLSVLRGWHQEVFAAREPALAERLERDAEAKRALVATVGPERLIEIATNGLKYVPQPWARRVVLIPHIAMRPWNVMDAWDDATIVCYPASDEAVSDPDEPPASLIRLHKALGDEKRLRILRRLARGPATLKELSDAAGVGKPTAHHHTVILRAAGLLSVTLEDDSRYSLRPGAVDETGAWLRGYLGTEDRP